MSWDSDQWVSYDDDQTLAMKKTYANNLCLRGTMVWALDQADPTNSQSTDNLYIQGMAEQDGDQAFSNKAVAMQKFQANKFQNYVTLQVFWTECSPNPTCPPGFKILTLGHGKTFDTERGQQSGEGCHGGGNGYNRALCAEANIRANGCAWYGKPKGCSQTCPKSTLLIAQTSHIGGAKTGCKSGHYSSYCCQSIDSDLVAECPSPVMEAQLSGGQAPRIIQRNYIGERIGHPNNWGYGTDAECAYAFNPLEGVGGIENGHNLVPFSGPQYILNGLVGTWVFGAGNTVNFVKLHNLPYAEIDLNDIQCTATYTITHEETTTGAITMQTCDYSSARFACQHYSSVQRTAANNAATLVCPRVNPGDARDIVDEYNRQHKTEWNTWIAQPPAGELVHQLLLGNSKYSCQRDEYPPNRFRGSPNPFRQWIRRVPSSNNNSGGQLWRNICRIKSSSNIEGGPVHDRICTEVNSITYTLPRFSMAFTNMPNDPDDGIGSAWCQLVTTLTDDAGYALLTEDQWYNIGGRGGRSATYAGPIPDALKAGKTPPRQRAAKRGLTLEPLPIEDLVIDDGNTTRLRPEEELYEKYGLQKCRSFDCALEREELGIADDDEEDDDHALDGLNNSPVWDKTSSATASDDGRGKAKSVVVMTSRPTPAAHLHAPVQTASGRDELRLRRRRDGRRG